MVWSIIIMTNCVCGEIHNVPKGVADRHMKHMKKFADICYCYWTWQNWQLKQSCQHIFHWFDCASYKILHQLQFFSSLISNKQFSQYWSESTTLGDQIDTNKSLIYEIFDTSKPPKTCACINFPHTFFNGTNWGYDLKLRYLLTRERYSGFTVRSETCME